MIKVKSMSFDKSPYDIVGLGNALLDLQVEVPFSFLEQNALNKGSMTLVDQDRQRVLLEQLKNLSDHGDNQTSVKKTSGGCTANTLAGVASFGGKSFFYGKVGQDEFGLHYRADLDSVGVESNLQMSSEIQTGTCLALITPDAERTMLTCLGAATEFEASGLNERVVDQAKAVYVEGYLWDPPKGREASRALIEMARAKGKKVALTYSDAFCVNRHRADFIYLAQHKLDILFCNEDEALQATHTTKVEEAFKIIKDWSPIVCITTGPRGALLSDRSQNLVEEIPTWDVKLVDKLGAGDLFASGVLYGLCRNMSLREAGLLGCYAATRIIQQYSARLDEVLSEEIETALRGPTKEEALRAASA